MTIDGEPAAGAGRSGASPDGGRPDRPTDRALLDGLFADDDISMAVLGADLTYLSFNAVYARELGRLIGREPPVGSNLLELTAERPELRAELVGLWSRALGGERFTIERRLGDDGRVFEVVFKPLRDAAGTVVGATHIGRDVTLRKRMEQALRESEERYRTLVETSPDGIYAYSRGRVVFANAEAARLLASDDPAELIGRSAWDIIHLDSLDAATARSCRLVREGRLGERRNPLTELTFRRLDGVPVPVEVASARITIDGQPAVQVAIRDITRRRAAEQALRRERELLQRILDTIPVMIVLYRPDTRVLQLNPAFERLTGWSSEEARRIDLMARCYPDPAYRKEVRAFMEALEAGWRDIAMTTRDGRVLQTSWANIRLPDDTHVGIGIDITERKLGEERLRLLLRELNHRVKNTLAMVSSIAARSLTGDRTPAEARQAFVERVQALAHAHDLLTVCEWRGVGLRTLATTELEVHGRQAEIRGDDLLLKPRAAQTLVLILHELATNAAKHGALSVPEGRVEVVWSVDREARGDVLRLVWQERDGPRTRPPTRRGFGLAMIEQAGAYDLGGEAVLEFRPAGLRCTLSAPLAALEVPSAPLPEA